MRNKFAFKKYIIFIVALVGICFVFFSVHNSVSKKQTEQELNHIISSITFNMEENDTEIKKLLSFKERVPDLSHRGAAIYYRNLTKLYILRADADNALLTFVNAHIQAEIAGAYDVVAWLYADITQVYIDFYTYDIAEECINTALIYAENQKMDDFFYEYCYVIKAELSARIGKTRTALEYYQISVKLNSDDLPEYQSMDLRRNLILADIAMKNKEYDKCKENLEVVGVSINNLDYPPLDVLWASGIYYPYLEMQAKLALNENNYKQALVYMDGMFAAGTLYGQMDRLMSFLTDTITTIDSMDTSTLPLELSDIVENYTKKLMKEYPKAFQYKNIMAGTHVYNSNMASIAVFIQKYDIESFYKVVTQYIFGAALVIAALILVWRGSERKNKIDGLTGAFSRKYFNIVYGNLNNSTMSFGVIMYDIDYFKQVNDNFGHEAGDLVLKDTSKKIINMLDRNCRLFRYGGDEFCIICKQKSISQMVEIAERVRVTVEEMNWEKELKATLSIGVAHSENSEKEVMAAVDASLYKSKEAGRNCVRW